MSGTVEMDNGMKSISVRIDDGRVEMFAADGYYYPTADELTALIDALQSARNMTAPVLVSGTSTPELGTIADRDAYVAALASGAVVELSR